ncbi:palindromic element RPE2 domain-containing protein [Candidatus Tisiphia endosymbiont of Nemotelus uliginosus]|uniref:palindromic element RPE2 domain-containing protein n=1 Tax=Candidatus Tisiphia endosymbiont of Nemotelus uliginosus TaxID=3077926 RepID=UPI0035C8FF33
MSFFARYANAFYGREQGMGNEQEHYHQLITKYSYTHTQVTHYCEVSMINYTDLKELEDHERYNDILTMEDFENTIFNKTCPAVQMIASREKIYCSKMIKVFCLQVQETLVKIPECIMKSWTELIANRLANIKNFVLADGSEGRVTGFIEQQNDGTGFVEANIVNSGEFGARRDGAKPIDNRRATSNDVTNFSSIDYNIQEETVGGAARAEDVDYFVLDDDSEGRAQEFTKQQNNVKRFVKANTTAVETIGGEGGGYSVDHFERDMLKLLNLLQQNRPLQNTEVRAQLMKLLADNPTGSLMFRVDKSMAAVVKKCIENIKDDVKITILKDADDSIITFSSYKPKKLAQ